MAMAALGQQIDIHGGGSDLIFPHHENEIAQSESYSDKAPFARYWVHTGMLSLPAADGVAPQEELEQEAVEETEAHEEASAKMSHSAGEAPTEPAKMAHSGAFVTIASTLASGEIPPMALRTYLLAQQYRANLVYSEEQLQATVVRWRRWAETRANTERVIAWAAGQPVDTSATDTEGATLRASAAATREAYITALDDDLNTSRALSEIDELAHRINDYATGLRAHSLAEGAADAMRESLAVLIEMTGALGIGLDEEARTSGLSEADTAEIERLVAQRDDARKARDWAAADEVRKKLESQFNVVVKDTPQGAVWSVKEG